jgi:hypothetical protein
VNIWSLHAPVPVPAPAWQAVLAGTFGRPETMSCSMPFAATT